jgi:Uma2 family endonuclease
MSTVTAPARFTPEDLIRMPDGERYELVDGQLVEHGMSVWSSYVAGKIYGRLDTFCQVKQFGWVLPEGTTYQCFPEEPSRVRRADVSFVRLERMSFEQATSEGHLRIAPDLGVEVLSPNDIAYDVDEKVQEYLRAGVRLIWVVNPVARTIQIHRPERQGIILHENDELDGEDVLPGFHCRVGDLFIPPAGAAPAVV